MAAAVSSDLRQFIPLVTTYRDDLFHYFTASAANLKELSRSPDQA